MVSPQELKEKLYVLKKLMLGDLEHTFTSRDDKK